MCVLFKVLVGNRMWMARNGISITDNVEQEIVYHEERGQTLAALNGTYSIYVCAYANCRCEHLTHYSYLTTKF